VPGRDRNRAYWLRFIESVADGVAILDIEGRCRRLNSAAELMLGFSEEECRSQSLHGFVHPDASCRGECGYLQSLRPENGWRLFDDVLITRSGERLDAELSAWPIFVDGAHDGFTLTLQSEGFRERRTDDLARTASLANLGALAATVAHEFNNILMGISPFATIVQRSAGDDRRLQKAGEHNQGAGERARLLVRELQQHTRPRQVVRAPIDVGSWLRDAMVELRPLIPPSIHLHLEIATPRLTIDGDRTQLTQVLTNLILNARDAIHEAGSITLVARNDPDSQRIQLEVRDTGQGIPPDDLTRIFAPLFTTKGEGGTGLGLAVSRRIVEAHGGSIDVSSVVGSGTRFLITLSQCVVDPNEGRQVLVMLEQESESLSMAAFLTASGFEATVASPARLPRPGGRLAVIVSPGCRFRHEDLCSVAAHRIVVGLAPGDSAASGAGTHRVEGFDLAAVLDILRREASIQEPTCVG
jgi:PAS domain S-box-containing protein